MNEATSGLSLLRVLEGPLTGAEAGLEPGRLLLGSGGECDIVLEGEGIAERHVYLDISGPGGTLEALAAGVMLNGLDVTPDEPRAITCGDTIGFGDILIGVGQPDSQFELPTSAAETTDDGEAAEEPEEPEAATGEESEPELPPAARTPEPAPARIASKSRKAVGRGRRLGYGFAVGVLLAMLIGVLPLLRQVPLAVSADSVAREQALHRTAALLHTLAFDHVEATATSGTDVVLKGYTETNERHEVLRQAIKGLPFPVNLQTWSREQMQADLRETLHRIGAGGVSVAFLDGGNIELSGYYGGTSSREEVLSNLRAEIPHLGEVSGDLRTLQDAVALLRSMVRDHGLHDALRIEASGSRVQVGGALDPDMMAHWRDIAAAFTLKVDGSPRIHDMVAGTDVAVAEVHAHPEAVSRPVAPRVEPVAKPVAKPAAVAPTRFPNIAIAGVIVPMRDNGHHLALLETGATLSTGDVVNGQFVVDKIEFNAVTLRSGEQTHVYYVGDHHG